MSNILTIGYTTEGPTDKRFLESIIKNTFDKVALQCESSISVYDPVHIKSPKNLDFQQLITYASNEAFKQGLDVMCIHIDSDHPSDQNVVTNKIIPMYALLSELDNQHCTNFVAIVPVRMSEAWMLADKDLLKYVLRTEKSNEELGINKSPESYADPKSVIMNALKIAQSHLPRRRDRSEIGEIYQPIGQNILIETLEGLESFRKFKSSVEDSFRKLNFLH